VSQQAEPGSRLPRHPLDPVSLVVGLLAVGYALVALLEVEVDVDGGLVLPVLLLAAGLAGLVAAVRRDRP
jgi:hypothetical protein